MEQVILVDQHDKPVGYAGKLEAHEKGLLHRAFSVLIFNSHCQLLLQRRALGKYHSPGLWTNTCCSHPRPGEAMEAAVQRRLGEEMGMEGDLSLCFKFIYRADLGELTEYEFDHVYAGVMDHLPVINPEEVEEWKYMDLQDLLLDMRLHPNQYTAWFHIIMKQLRDEPSLLSEVLPKPIEGCPCGL